MRRSLGHLIAIATALCLALGCNIPGPKARPEERQALTRESVRVRKDRTEPHLELSYLLAGTAGARRIVYLHGTPGSAEGWSDYLIDPVPGFESIAVDRPGFGESRPAAALPSLEDQARALAPLFDGKPAAILVGHSLGAPVAAQAAVDFPASVRALVLLAGSLDPDLEKVYWIQRLGRLRPIEWLLPRWARHSNRELIDLEGHLRSLAPKLAEVRCPVVIVHGTEDALVPYANVPFMERQFANAPLEVIRLNGQNHFLPWNSPSVVREAIARAEALAEESP